MNSTPHDAGGAGEYNRSSSREMNGEMRGDHSDPRGGDPRGDPRRMDMLQGPPHPMSRPG